LPRTIHIPLRDEEVVALGRATRLKYAGRSIKEVARDGSIILRFVSSGEIKRGGMCIYQSVETSYLFESLVDEGRLIEARYPAVPSGIKLIAIANDYEREGERISLEEIFWHEYFHIHWSPELPPYDPDKHEWSTHGVLDKQDEHRADLFAASVLIDRITEWDDASTIAERCHVSLRLAGLSLHLDRRKGLFSRDWTPEYKASRSISQP
jgi:hypothetical protein